MSGISARNASGRMDVDIVGMELASIVHMNDGRDAYRKDSDVLMIRDMWRALGTSMFTQFIKAGHVTVRGMLKHYLRGKGAKLEVNSLFAVDSIDVHVHTEDTLPLLIESVPDSVWCCSTCAKETHDLSGWLLAHHNTTYEGHHLVCFCPRCREDVDE